MALSKEWYDAEFVNSESESLHRAPSIEYSFYNAVKTGDMEYVIKNCKEDAFTWHPQWTSTTEMLS